MAKQRTILIIIVVASAAIFGAYKFGAFSSDASTQQTQVNKDNGPALVSAQIVSTRVLENKITITGTVIANEAVDITTEIAGKIEKIYFEEGKKVNKGDLLIQLNNDELKAQYDKLKYNQKLRQENEFRQRQLLEKEAISQEEYDIALTEFNTSIADIKLLEAQLDKTSIKAPFSGTVGLRYVSEGAFVNSNTRIAYLANINPAKVEFSIPGKYSNSIRLGDDISFIADGINTPFNGKVYAIDPQIDQNTRTMKLRAICENSNGLLLPGQFARVDLKLKSSENAIMLPNEAVVPELNGHKVYKYDEGKAMEVKVKVGLRTASEIEISEGLAIGDTVIVTGILIIKNGSEVNITTYN